MPGGVARVGKMTQPHSSNTSGPHAVFKMTEETQSEGLFTSIWVHTNTHPNAPKELWTRENIDLLSQNIGRPIPTHVEHAFLPTVFNFVGSYRIVDWRLHKAGSAEAVAYIATLKTMQRSKKDEYWAEVSRGDWAQVELEKVVDPILVGNPKHRYVQRYAEILNKVKRAVGSSTHT